MPIKLEIVTPERLVFDETVDAVTLPGSEGELGILPHHAPLVSTLGVGELRIRSGGQEEYFAIAGGFVQVLPDKVVVMAETADSLPAEVVRAVSDALGSYWRLASRSIVVRSVAVRSVVVRVGPSCRLGGAAGRAGS